MYTKRNRKNNTSHHKTHPTHTILNQKHPDGQTKTDKTRNININHKRTALERPDLFRFGNLCEIGELVLIYDKNSDEIYEYR